MSEKERLDAKRIMSMLISARSIANAQNDDAESRVDYISDRLGMERQETFKLLQILREEGILANTMDLTAYILKTDTENKSLNVLKKYAAMEQFLVSRLSGEGQCINLKELNESAVNSGIKNATVNYKTRNPPSNFIASILDKYKSASSISLSVISLPDCASLNKIRYKADDYKSLNEYYKHKIQQIHIVGEFANMMVRNYDEALQFVKEYFQMDYKLFIAKYFKGNRKSEHILQQHQRSKLMHENLCLSAPRSCCHHNIL